MKMVDWRRHLKVSAVCWLLCSLLLTLNVQLSNCENGYTVPNPFFNQRNQQEQQDNTHNNFYHILATEFAGHKHEVVIDEFFSLGRGLSYALHTSRNEGSWAVLTDGRAGRSYLLRNPDEVSSEHELDCQLDHVHSHKHLFPWQYIYEVSRTGGGSGGNLAVVAPPVGLLPELETDAIKSNRTVKNREKRRKRRFKATIFGIGAIWLNMIKADIRSSQIGSSSSYRLFNAWKLETNGTKIDLLFHKRPQAEQLLETNDFNSIQMELDKSQPAELKVRTKLRERSSSERDHLVSMFVQIFETNLEEEQSEQLQKFRLQLNWCRRQNRFHQQFPNLLRALATSSERIYKIDYVTKRFNLFGSDLLDGKFNSKHHRYMWPSELTSEVLSLKRDVQTLIYDASPLNAQASERMDLFMARFTENAQGRSPRHATAHYHDVVFDDDESAPARSCIKGEREPKPKLRLLTSSFTFKTAHELEYQGHIHGIGALLLNAAEMRHSFNLASFKINLPNSLDEFDQMNRRTMVNVWQVHDERDQVRVLFFIEKRNPQLEPRQLDLAERDRGELARLVRIDIRSVDLKSGNVAGNEDNELDPLAISQDLIDRDDDLMVQYHIFNFDFELDEVEAEVFLDIPDECLNLKPVDDGDSSDEDENDDEKEHLHDLDYNKTYHDDDDNDDEDDEDYDESDDTMQEDSHENDKEAELDFESGLLDEFVPLPEFLEQLGDQTSYQFTTRLELLDADNKALKAIWLVEHMDLAKERAWLKVYTSRSALAHKRPSDEFFIVYQSELVFHIKGDDQRRCQRVEDVPLEWLRLFSGHLVYYLIKPEAHDKHPHELTTSDLVVESNQLSSFGIGALWRRANQLGSAEFKGRRMAEEHSGDNSTNELVWAYDELDMRFEFAFRRAIDADHMDEHHAGSHSSDLKLYSILIRNQHQRSLHDDDDILGQQLEHFKSIRAIVEEAQIDDPQSVSTLPIECKDQLIEAQRVLEQRDKIEPPSPETVFGLSQRYEINYSIYTNRNRPTSHEQRVGLEQTEVVLEHSGRIRVRESFDRQQNRGKIVINYDDPKKELAIYIDGQRRLFLAMSKELNKCSIITELSPTFNTMLATMVFDNVQFDPNQFHGLLGLWQALSKHQAKLHVKQLFSVTGNRIEEQIYTLDVLSPPNEAGNRERHEQVEMHFEKRQAGQWGALDVFEKDKVRIRPAEALSLRMLEFKPVTKRSKGRRTISDEYTRIFISKARDELTEKWQLPKACEQLLDANQDQNSETNSETPNEPLKPEPAGKPIQLPKVTDLLQRSRRFSMRSETSILGGLDKLYLLDELYKEGDLRLSSHGLGAGAERNCDLLMFFNTRELFDFSEPFQCKRLELNSSSEIGERCLKPSLLGVWHEHSSEVTQLANLFYGPLSLWRLAEQIAFASDQLASEHSNQSVKFIKSIEVSKTEPFELGNNEEVNNRLKRTVEREIWLVSNIAAGWSYQMEFTKVVDEGSGAVKNEWHVLDSVQVTDKNELGETISVFIEVINYNYEPEKGNFAKLFQLPEGWNCQRKTTQVASLERQFQLKLSSKLNTKLSYEASLELMDSFETPSNDNQLELKPSGEINLELERRGLPTQIGALHTGGDLDDLLPAHWRDEHSELPRQPKPRFQIDLQQSVARFSNGYAIAKQVVIDRMVKLAYDFDAMSGSCAIELVPDFKWGLSFATPTIRDNRLFVTLADDMRQLQATDLFEKLFLLNYDLRSGDRMFHLVNVFVEESDHQDGVNVLHVHYEHQFDFLTLMSGYSGPARVVRKFEMALPSGAGLDPVESIEKHHQDYFGLDHSEMDSVSVRLYLLTKDKLKVRAVFDMSLFAQPPVSLSELLAMTNVAECYNEGQPMSDRRLASFVLEYALNGPTDNMVARMFADEARDHFYALLLAQNRLLPSQLDGKAHFEFSQHDQLMRVHFNVLEAPSSYVYFQQRYQCTMKDRMSIVAETRVLPNLLACSRWCDQVNCIAMSYCDDNQCQVVTKRALFGRSKSKSGPGRSNKKLNDDDEATVNLGLLEECSLHTACTYHYNKLQVRPRPLSAFSDFLDRTVNFRSNKVALRELALPLGRSQRWLEPVRFSESSDKFRWQHENYLDPFEEAFEVTATGSGLANISSAAGTSGSDISQVGATFAIWQPNSEFCSANKLDQLNDKLKFGHQSKFLIMWSAASNRAGCLKECQRNQCLLVASCPNENRCQMIVASGGESILQLGELKENLIISNSLECTISIRDHLHQFHLYRQTQKPEKYSHQLEGYTKEECAAACHLRASNCLAFDVCNYFGPIDEKDQIEGQQESVCFLQNTHTSQDAFDRSVLLPTWDIDALEYDRNTLNGRQISCDHYSKSVLAEFQRVPNRKLRRLHQSELLGVNADKCAADCLQDDTCQAFEHCQNPRRAPTESCYLIRIEAEGDEAQGGKLFQPLSENNGEGLKNQLVLSRSCSIYLAKAALNRQRLEQTLDKVPTGTSFGLASLLASFKYLLVAVVFGSIVQVAYIRLTNGRALILHDRNL